MANVTGAEAVLLSCALEAPVLKDEVESVGAGNEPLRTSEDSPAMLAIAEINPQAVVAKKEPVRVDRDDRPSLSYKDLIIEAIESSPEKRLKLSEIYQVIRYLHPFYEKRPDQWGWQNSIRHNLSLHDCFVKLPMKQTSANGVVGHFWTVCRDREDKNPRSSTRRRNRQAGGVGGSGRRASRAEIVKGQNGGGSAHSHHALKERSLKGVGKERQSVSSSDSGVMSDESQSTESPTSALEAALCLGGVQQQQPSTSSSSSSSDSSSTGGLIDPASVFAAGMPSYDWTSCSAVGQFDMQLLVRKMQEAMHHAGAGLRPSDSIAAPSPSSLPPSFSLPNSGEAAANQYLSHLFGMAQLGRIGANATVDNFPNSMQTTFDAGDVMNSDQLKKLQLLNLYAQQQQQQQAYCGLNNAVMMQHQMAALDAAARNPPPVAAVPSTTADPALLSSLLAQVLLAKLATSPSPPASLTGPPRAAPLMDGLVQVPSTSLTSLRPPPSQLLINNQYPLPAVENEPTLIKPIPRIPSSIVSDSAAGLSAEMQWQLRTLQSYLASQHRAAEVTASSSGLGDSVESGDVTSGVKSGDVMVA